MRTLTQSQPPTARAAAAFEIIHAAGRTGQPMPSQRALGQALGGRHEANLALAELVRAGCLTIERRRGRRRALIPATAPSRAHAGTLPCVTGWSSARGGHQQTRHQLSGQEAPAAVSPGGAGFRVSGREGQS